MPGHVGIPRNITADALAQAALRGPDYLRPEMDPWQLMRELRQRLTLYRDETFGTLPSLPLKGLTRKEATLIMRARTGGAFARSWLTECGG